jgi:hypothetical protein
MPPLRSIRVASFPALALLAALQIGACSNMATGPSALPVTQDHGKSPVVPVTGDTPGI